MLDVPWLASWIRSRHLREDSLRAYRGGFASHPARLLTLKPFLREEMVEPAGRFLAEEAEYQPMYGLHGYESEVEDV